MKNRKTISFSNPFRALFHPTAQLYPKLWTFQRIFVFNSAQKSVSKLNYSTIFSSILFWLIIFMGPNIKLDPSLFSLFQFSYFTTFSPTFLNHYECLVPTGIGDFTNADLWIDFLAFHIFQWFIVEIIFEMTESIEPIWAKFYLRYKNKNHAVFEYRYRKRLQNHFLKS